MHGRDLKPLTLVVLAVLASTLALSACTSNRNPDSKRTLVIDGAVHVYPTDTPPAGYPGTNFIDVLGPTDHVKVRQVIYKNGYMAVKVRLRDGREGWVFSGESIELK
jgi:hypothetical protein